MDYKILNNVVTFGAHSNRLKPNNTPSFELNAQEIFEPNNRASDSDNDDSFKAE